MKQAHIEWCNENEGRAYPIDERATCIDDSGRILPTAIIADLQIMLPPAYAAAYISSVWVTRTLTGLSLTHANQPLASVVVDRTIYTPYTAVALQPMPGMANVSGCVVLGGYRYHGDARWLFKGVEQSGIADRAKVINSVLPVTGIRKSGGAAESAARSLVRVIGDGYIQLLPHETDPNTIVVTLREGDRSLFVGPCVTLADHGDCGTPPIRSINGVCPDASGILHVEIE